MPLEKNIHSTLFIKKLLQIFHDTKKIHSLNICETVHKIICEFLSVWFICNRMFTVLDII